MRPRHFVAEIRRPPRTLASKHAAASALLHLRCCICFQGWLRVTPQTASPRSWTWGLWCVLACVQRKSCATKPGKAAATEFGSFDGREEMWAMRVMRWLPSILACAGPREQGNGAFWPLASGFGGGLRLAPAASTHPATAFACRAQGFPVASNDGADVRPIAARVDPFPNTPRRACSGTSGASDRPRSGVRWRNGVPVHFCRLIVADFLHSVSPHNRHGR